MAGDRRDFAVQSALSRAVETERLAIDRHEAAARRLDQLAAEMEGHALQDRDEQLQERAIELAAVARERAQCEGAAGQLPPGGAFARRGSTLDRRRRSCRGVTRRRRAAA